MTVLTCRNLDELHCGTIYLSVPLVDDVIQIGIGGDPDVGTIEVIKMPTALQVRRVDGRPMQAQLLEHHASPDGPVRRTTVFDEPVLHLGLQRVDSGSEPRPWICTSSIRGERHRSVGQFIRTIATFGLAKQRRALG